MKQVSTTKPTVLIVDDNKKNLQVLGNILHEHYKVAMAIEGNSAIKLAQQINPDIIILDIMMPGIDGFDVIKILKSDDQTKDIPVIFLTAKVEQDDVIEGFSLGAVDYITKPFKKQELLVRVKNHLDLIFSKRKIQDQAKKLETANQFKDKMFSIIGHDLRSAISSIKLTLDMVVSGLINPDEDDFIDTIDAVVKSTEEAYTLLENLLGWAKAESGTINVIPEGLLMSDLAAGIQRLNEQNLQNKKIELELDVEEQCYAWADSQMINTVLRNLVSNAIKFTPANGKITIRSKYEGERVKTDIIDTGVGIPPGNLEKLLEERGTVKTYGTNNEPGSGLGLILCKDFIEKNGGSLSIISEVGKGSTFSFSLPKPQDL